MTDLAVIKAAAGEWLRSEPLLYAPVARRREKPYRLRRVVRPGDDFVIDGFPRSANTFSTHAFLLAQPEPVKVGNHTHAAAQFRLAARYGVPSLLVIREPIGAVVSAMVYTSSLDPAPHLVRYITFHRALRGLQDAFVVGRFDELTNDFGAVIKRVNARFGTEFGDQYGSTEDVFASIRRHHDKVYAATGVLAPERLTIPSDDRSSLKARALAQIGAERHGQLLARAQSIFQEIAGS